MGLVVEIGWNCYPGETRLSFIREGKRHGVCSRIYISMTATVPFRFPNWRSTKFFQAIRLDQHLSDHLLVNCRFTLPFTVEKIRLAQGYTIRIWVLPVHLLTSVTLSQNGRCFLCDAIWTFDCGYEKSFFLYLHPVRSMYKYSCHWPSQLQS